MKRAIHQAWHRFACSTRQASGSPRFQHSDRSSWLVHRGGIADGRQLILDRRTASSPTVPERCCMLFSIT